MTTYSGSCHCGAISFTFDGEIDQVVDCNCSYCLRQGRLLTFVGGSAFRVNAAEGALGTYMFNRNVIAHHFCTRCGVATHSGGPGPNGPMHAVNVRCVEGVDFDALAINKFDGAHI